MSISLNSIRFMKEMLQKYYFELQFFKVETDLNETIYLVSIIFFNSPDISANCCRLRRSYGPGRCNFSIIVPGNGCLFCGFGLRALNSVYLNSFSNPNYNPNPKFSLTLTPY